MPLTSEPTFSRSRLLAALASAGGNRKRAAQQLGIGRATLYRWLERFGIEPGVTRLIGGRYELQEPVGEGGQATVFRARDLRSGEDGPDVALKLIRVGQQRASDVERWRHEARTLSTLRHPGLVRVHDLGIDEATGQPFLVMDLVPGRPFAVVAAEHDVTWILRAFAAVVQAVGHLHRHGVIHRDLKSENVLVDDTAAALRLTVMDLGLAEDLANAPVSSGGTLLYAAPELIAGGRASPRTDIYALGVLLYVALTGRYPFAGETATETLRVLRSNTPLAPSQLRGELSPEVDQLVLRLLAANPAERVHDTTTLLEAVARLLGDTPLEVERRTGSLQLLGRDETLARTLATLNDAQAAPCLLLSAEDGLGKTRLLEACAAELKLLGRSVVTFDLARGTDPLLSQAWSDDREALLAQLVEPIAAQAARQPLVVVIDDLHLAEALLLEFVWRLARAAAQLPLRLLASARPIDAWPTTTAGSLRAAIAEGLVGERALEPLDVSGVRAIAAEVVGSARAATLAETLHRLTGGAPLFLEMVLADMAKRPASSALDNEQTLPRSLRQAARSFLGKLSGVGKRTVRAIAIAGRGVSEEDLRRVERDAERAVIDTLVSQRILVQDSHGLLRLANEPLRDSVLEEILSEDAHRLHRAWAAVTAGQPEWIVEHAAHLLAANAGADVRDVLIAAADRLERRWRYAEAAEFLVGALARTRNDDQLRLKLMRRLDQLYRLVRNNARAIDVCQRWAELAHRLGDNAEEARALGLLASRFRDRCEWDTARDAAQRAVALADRAGVLSAQALARKVLASVLWCAWDHHAALAQMEEALELCRRAGDVRLLAIALHDMALVRATSGFPAKSLAGLDEAGQLFRSIQDDAWLLAIQINTSLIMAFLGDLDGAAARLESMLAAQQALSSGISREYGLEALCFVTLRSGHYDRALTAADALVAESIRFDHADHRIVGLLAAAEALLELDDRAAAREHAQLALDLAEALGEPRQAAFARLALARDFRHRGEFAPAQREAHAALADAAQRSNLRVEALAAIELARLAVLEKNAADAGRWLDHAERALCVQREDGPSQRTALLLERTRAHRLAGQWQLARAAAHEGLGLADSAGPRLVGIFLQAELVELYDDLGDEPAAHRARRELGERIERFAAAIADSRRRSAWLARPDIEALQRTTRGARDPSAPVRGAAPHTAGALAGLYEVSRAISGDGEIGPVLQRVVELAVGEAHAQRGLLVLQEPAGLVPAARLDVETETEQDALTISRSVLTAASRGVSIVSQDALADPALAQATSVALFGIRSLMCVPLRLGNEVLGTLYVDTRDPAGSFSPDDVRFLEALADQAAVAIAYARLVGNLTREKTLLQRAAEGEHRFGNLVGRSEAMKQVFTVLERIAPTDLPVIVCGESGTGKELVARAIHFNSLRKDRPLLSENCAAIPETLLESLLFGHVRGAFTGADAPRQGLFELADGGTLLLDEIGDMSFALQAKLLRVLQEGEFRPLGGERAVRVNVRVIAATHRDLPELVRFGQFRQDLYFRLNGVTVTLPPLRERLEDLPLLVEAFLRRDAAVSGSESCRISGRALQYLARHDWPGNVRELQNVVRRLEVFAEGGLIDLETLHRDPDLGPRLFERPAADHLRPGPSDERARLQQLLTEVGGDKHRAAGRLGMSRATFYRRLKQHGLL